jgi:hypothetical protein
MYGRVNQATEDLVRTRHGDAAWEALPVTFTQTPRP